LQESINTLKFGRSAGAIKNNVKVNEKATIEKPSGFLEAWRGGQAIKESLGNFISTNKN